MVVGGGDPGGNEVDGRVVEELLVVSCCIGSRRVVYHTPPVVLLFLVWVVVAESSLWFRLSLSGWMGVRSRNANKFVQGRCPLSRGGGNGGGGIDGTNVGYIPAGWMVGVIAA